MSAAFHRALVDTLLPGGVLPHDIALPPGSSLGLEAAVGGEVTALVAAAAGGEDAFLSASAAERDAFVAAAIAKDAATMTPFIALLVKRYYEDARVITAFGWPARPPQPRGHALPDFDENLLGPVRARSSLWRAT